MSGTAAAGQPGRPGPEAARPAGSAPRLRDAGHARPIPAEHYSGDGSYTVRFELPGINAARDLAVSVEAGVLSVWAVRRPGRTARLRDYHTEFGYGLLCQHVPLPAGANGADVSATYQDGILEVRVGMSGEHPVRKVPVEVATGNA